MVVPPALSSVYLHTCTIRHRTGWVQDTHGGTGPVSTDTVTPCKFYHCQVTGAARGGIPILFDAVKIVLPGTVTITNEDQIITTATGYAGTYQVLDAEPGSTRGGIRNYDCSIQKVI